MCLEPCLKTNSGYQGKLIGTEELAANWEECAYRCLQEENCVAWVYAPKDYVNHAGYREKCFIKGAGNWNPGVSGLIAGLKDCITGICLHFHVPSSLSFF